jgi:hypothetical protein
MINLLFVAALGVILFSILYWAFRTLPGEKWQVLAAIPSHKSPAGHWHGTNITSYGLIVACSYLLAAMLTLVLLGAIAVSLSAASALLLIMLLLVLPASRLVALLVEKKAATFTVGGASFVGIVMAPWIAHLANSLGQTHGVHVPIIASLAVFAIAYSFGEGLGRLGCVTFGCCYGKPLEHCHPLVQKIFRHRHFVFIGHTKKITYAGKMEGFKVVPIQAVTSVVYIVTGLLGTWLFLNAYYSPALVLTLGVTQLWRAFSETLRADYRGNGRISAYQIMALLSVIYTFFAVWWFPSELTRTPDLVKGLSALWQPGIILFLQLLWISTFVFYGRSLVTRAQMSFHVCEQHI